MTDNCYVIQTGDCISPLSCAHGDGLDIDRFILEARQAGCTDNAFSWITKKAVELQEELLKH